MTTYIGAQPRTVGNILWERPRKPVHRCPALEAARDEVWVDHKQRHAADYRLFADTWPAQMRARLAGEIFDAVLAADLDDPGPLMLECDNCGHDSHYAPCEAALIFGDHGSVCNCPYPPETVGDADV